MQLVHQKRYNKMNESLTLKVPRPKTLIQQIAFFCQKKNDRWLASTQMNDQNQWKQHAQEKIKFGIDFNLLVLKRAICVPHGQHKFYKNYFYWYQLLFHKFSFMDNIGRFNRSIEIQDYLIIKILFFYYMCFLSRTFAIHRSSTTSTHFTRLLHISRTITLQSSPLCIASTAGLEPGIFGFERKSLATKLRTLEVANY